MLQVSEEPDISCCTSPKQFHGLVSAGEAYLLCLILDIAALQGLPWVCSVLSFFRLCWLCLWRRATIAHAGTGDVRASERAWRALSLGELDIEHVDERLNGWSASSFCRRSCGSEGCNGQTF